MLATRDVMLQLRSGVDPEAYSPTVQRMMREGYRLICLRDDSSVAAVAGFRIFEMLYAGGLLLYVDDLSTHARRRSRGYGRQLMKWLKGEPVRPGCSQLHLDSGVQRAQAHRFYFREGTEVNCFHFRLPL